MRFRGFSALRIFAIAACIFAVLAMMSVRTSAVTNGPDWTNSDVNFELVGDYAWNDKSQYLVSSNIVSESVTAKVNDGSWALPRLTDRTHLVYPTSVGYFDGYYSLPLGSNRWQTIDRGDFVSSAFYGNPTGAGSLVFVNGAGGYHSGPLSLHYVPDWREMFGRITTDSQGNVIRHVTNGFNIVDTPVLKNASGAILPINTQAAAAFSKNGQWLYLNSDIGQLRAHIPDLSYTVVSPRVVDYYTVYSAVSNTGRFVVAGSYNNHLTVYDADNCVSNVCAKKDLYTSAKTKYAKTLPSGVSLGAFDVVGVKFVSEAKLEVYFWATRSDGIRKYIQSYVSVDPGLQATRYLALGDSFSSGEGAGNYYDATAFYADVNNFNECHQSRLAYSEVLNKWMSPSWYDSAACSGAKVKDIQYQDGEDEYVKHGYPQAKNPVEDLQFFNNIKQSLQPGYLPQLSLLQANSSTVSTITIGGNDIGFGDIVAACITQTRCYTNRDDRERLADLIASQIPKIRGVYVSLLENMSGLDPHLYAVGYPQIVNQNTACNSFMSNEERTFANNLVNYLNASIQIAAAQAGVQYVDVSDAFFDYQTGEDFRLCGNTRLAMNGLTIDLASMSDTQKLMQYIVNSYHPNELGHTLLAKRIYAYSNGLTRTMPAANAISSTPNSSLYTALVGDGADAINEYTEVHQDIVRNAVVNLDGALELLFSLNHIGDIPANLSTVRIELHSSPINLTSFTIDTSGRISGSLVLPKGLETGMHTLHVFYTDISGQTHDDMQYIFVIGSKDDFDNDGIMNNDENCVIGSLLGIDADHDGIDDACDSEIVERPKESTTQPSETTLSTEMVTNPQTLTNGSGATQNVALPQGLAQVTVNQSMNKDQQVLSDTNAAMPNDEVKPKVARQTGVDPSSASPPFVLVTTLAIVSTAIGITLWIKHKRVSKHY